MASQATSISPRASTLSIWHQAALLMMIAGLKAISRPRSPAWFRLSFRSLAKQ